MAGLLMACASLGDGVAMFENVGYRPTGQTYRDTYSYDAVHLNSS